MQRLNNIDSIQQEGTTRNPFKKITADLSKFKLGGNIKHSFQELGLEMSRWFKKSEHRFMWSLFHKAEYPEGKIRDAFKVCQERGIKSVRYLIGVLKRL